MVTVELDGKTYGLRFSLRVMKDCTEKYGSIEKLFDFLSGKAAKVDGEENATDGEENATDEDVGMDVLDCIVWLTSKMMESGYAYAKLNHIDVAEPLTEEGILDTLDVYGLHALRKAMFQTINLDNNRNVMAALPKTRRGKKTAPPQEAE